MSKSRGQSVFRAIRRGNMDERGNRTIISSTKTTKSGMNTPGVYRKGKYTPNKGELMHKEFIEKNKPVKIE